MITKSNLRNVLKALGFTQSDSTFTKHFEKHNCDIHVDFSNETIIYPLEIDTGANTTTNFSQNENFVVLECVCRLLEKGYKPHTIFLEKSWQLGHTGKSGRADITVYDKDADGKPNHPYLIIECKCAGKEYKAARKDMFENPDGKQLFSYWAQARSVKWLELYASDYDEESGEITFQEELIRSCDDDNVEALAQEDSSVLIFKNASTAEDAFIVWEETYSKKVYNNNIIFGDDAAAYKIGNTPLTNRKLKKFTKDDSITDRFREILRHNSISDKENAFNKLLSLFICKLVDETLHNAPDSVMAFQYVDGSDNYYILYERLLGLFQIGMRDFLKEEVFYLENDYIRKTLNQFTGKKRELLEKELVDTFQKTKMLSCQVFAFREVYNEKLFLQNGKVLVEVVELFQNYRMSYTSKEQLLGDLFENLLDQGFKQEAGQFFTPIPITRFVWNALPIERFLDKGSMTVPRVVDFACGSGHFLTEGIAAVSDYYNADKADNKPPVITDKEISKTFFGVDKDNRLARVSKVALLLNGADEAHIKAADGLEHDESFYDGGLHSFDILVANPPYSVDSFKAHESQAVKKRYETIGLMSTNCKDIQNVFVERMQHLLKPKGIAGIVMPSSILSNTANADIKTREIILQHFHIRAVASFAGKTFGATGTTTIILFLEQFDFPPQKARLVQDSVSAILNNEVLTDWHDAEIFTAYLEKIGVQETDYRTFLLQSLTLFNESFVPYFAEYEKTFASLTGTKTALGKIAKAQAKEAGGAAVKRNEKSQAELKALLQTEFYNWVKDCEAKKILYFALTYTGKTLVITAPSGNDEQKKFLGYEFSTRRGEEGMTESDGSLTNLHNRNDTGKLAWFVKQAFDGVECSSPEYGEYVSYIRTADMLDFSRPSFDLQLKLTADKKITIQSKYNLVKVKDICEIGRGKVMDKHYMETHKGEYPVYSSQTVNEGIMGKINSFMFNGEYVTWTTDGIYAGTCFYRNGKFNCTNVCGILKVKDKNLAITKFLSLVLNTITPNYVVKVANPKLMNNVMAEIQLPLPPLTIQQQIVTECEKVDEEYSIAQKTIEENKQKIEEVMSEVKGEMKRLGSVISLEYGKALPENKRITGQYPVMGSNGIIGYHNEFLVEGPSIIVGRKGSAGAVNWVEENNFPIDTTYYVQLLTDTMDMKFVYHSIINIGLESMNSSIGAPGLNRNDAYAMDIPVPSLEEQQRIVQKIETYEAAITAAKSVLAACADKKKMILKKWL